MIAVLIDVLEKAFETFHLLMVFAASGALLLACLPLAPFALYALIEWQRATQLHLVTD